MLQGLDLLANCLAVPACGFGIDSCSTTINVSSGFWAVAAYDPQSKRANVSAYRCPPRYCDGADGVTLLQSPLVSNISFSCPLNRQGRLCGMCQDSFTQSIDGHSCIPNSVCVQRLPWIWTVRSVIVSLAVFMMLPHRSTCFSTHFKASCLH